MTQNKGFLKIPNWYWECGLTLVEVNTIAQIASWQRENKQFFQSAESLACKFGISYSQMRKVLGNLVDKGIIKKNGKFKRMWKYKVDEMALNKLWMASQCTMPEEDTTTTEQKDPRYYSQEVEILSPESNYNTNKTSLYKTSLREESSSKLSSEDLAEFASSIEE